MPMKKVMEEIILEEQRRDAKRRSFVKSLEFVASPEFREKVLAFTKVLVELESMIDTGHDPNMTDELIASLAKREIIDLVMKMIKQHLFSPEMKAEIRSFDKSLEFVASPEFREKVLALTKVVVDLTKEGLIDAGHNNQKITDELIASLAKREIIELVIKMIKQHLFPPEMKNE